MNNASARWRFPGQQSWEHVLLVAAVVVGCGLLIALVRALVRRSAKEAPSRHRLVVLRAAPVANLAVAFAGTAIVVALMAPPFGAAILVAVVVLALAFALKEYISSLVAGIVTIVENTYLPGDWIKFEGACGEVKSIGARAVHIVTANDTEVIIPQAKMLSNAISNGSSGRRSLLTTTNFYLAADHDGVAVSRALAEVAATSPHLKSGSRVSVTAAETPFGTHYKIRARVAESREQSVMVTDLTLRGKDRLRAMKVTFAEAPYAEVGK